MADNLNPLLIFPQAVRLERHKLPSGRGNFHIPEPQRQVDRLGPKFTVLQQAFDNQRARLGSNPDGAEIEKVVVVELIGEVKDFFRTVRLLDGLEWLAEFEEEIESDEDFYISDDDRQSGLAGRLYLIMSNQQGLQQLL